MEPSFELKERDGCIFGLTPELSGAVGVRLNELLGAREGAPGDNVLDDSVCQRTVHSFWR